ncbi:serine/threonine protein kinase [Streptomyces verrucosisporus]|uniref:serine/threonine-protein kinase n=1 Tax=Streptomyces verrucosisporus TaxID=1695161 RepID=UPI0019D101D4|nr:serine/threonine-protein kinase [Streptomyces verrucosisporus]MBN3930260.1 serine/threonine protein kinase [Streptomyces verrucosisporus]
MRPVGSKYLLEEQLGRGATGTVWRARQREAAGAEAAVAGHPGETVAIKVLKEELASDPDVVMRFLRERSVLLRLTHPNIVRTRDLVVEGELLALVMDLIDGPDLDRYLRQNGPFSPVAAALLTAQIADALAASHADDVVHRDLKPANVLLAGSEDDPAGLRPMLTDFGIARLADSPGLTRTHEFVGTPAYVAPESAEGRPQTSAVDVYGAGILLYELVTGRPPFGGGTALELLQRHLTEEPQRPGNVPLPLWTVIERCLRKNPGERPGAENLARALRTVAEGIGVHATPARAEAAMGVAALLGPDPSPAPVPGQAPAGASDATQVLPTTGRPGDGTPVYDPDAVTGFLPHAGAAGPGGPGAGGSDEGATQVMPPMPPGAPAGGGDGPGPEDPHPWQTQLRAARDRNEQTQIQPLDPEHDPLRRRPQRRAAPQQYQRPEHQQPGYQQQPPPQPQQRARQQQPRQPYAPAPRHRPEPQPQRYEPPRPPEPRREPRPPRQRGANPMRIPGLGCLKGCLFMVLIFVLICVLVWNFTPLPEWWDQGRQFWEDTKDWVGEAWTWMTELGNTAEELPTDLPSEIPTEIPANN